MYTCSNWYVWNEDSKPLEHSLHLVGREGRVDGANLDVGVDDIGVGMRLLNRLRDASLGVAAATGNTRLARVSISRVVAVEPVHVGSTGEFIVSLAETKYAESRASYWSSHTLRTSTIFSSDLPMAAMPPMVLK